MTNEDKKAKLKFKIGSIAISFTVFGAGLVSGIGYLKPILSMVGIEV